MCALYKVIPIAIMNMCVCYNFISIVINQCVPLGTLYQLRGCFKTTASSLNAKSDTFNSHDQD